MIHTDGRPTIANAETRAVAATDTALGGIFPLMERVTGGLHVELLYIAGGLLVRVTEGEDGRVFTGNVPPHQAREAFDHPYMFVKRD